jgi:hypothetical protein
VHPLSDPGNKSYDHEDAGGHHGGERTGHPDPHRNLNQAEIFIHVATLVSMKLHFGHSKVRFSERPGLRTMLVKSIRVRHLPQCGHSIGNSNTSVSERGM